MAKNIYQTMIRLMAGLGYVSLLLQWFFVIIISLSAASHYAWFNNLFQKPTVQPAEPIVSAPAPTVGVVDWLIILLVIVILIAAVWYTIRKLPGSIVRTGKLVTHRPAELVVPFMLRHGHKRPTKARRRQLTARVIVIIKGILIVLPNIVLIMIHPMDVSLEPIVLWSVAFFLTAQSIVWFGLEWLLVTLGHVSLDKTD